MFSCLTGINKVPYITAVRMRFSHVTYKWSSPSRCCMNSLRSLNTHRTGQPGRAFKELIFELFAVKNIAKLADGPRLSKARQCVCVCFVSPVNTLCLSSHKWLIRSLSLENSAEQKVRDDLHRQMLVPDREATDIVRLDTEFVDPLMSIGLRGRRAEVSGSAWNHFPGSPANTQPCCLLTHFPHTPSTEVFHCGYLYMMAAFF
jgi:hypothetical protein